MKGLKVAVVGAGAMGQTHAVAYSRIDEVKRLIICDIILDKAEKLAAKVSADEAYANYRDILAMEEIDIVDVCVPTPTHPEITVAAAEAGKHVICEKPIALTLREAERMIRAAEKAGVKFMVAHVLRFWPEYKVLKEIVDSGDVGEALTASGARLSSPPAWADWFLDPEMSGGAVIDLHIHDLDFLNWLFGKPLEISCRGRKSKEDAWDHMMTTIKYPHQKTGFAIASWFMPVTFPFTMKLRVTCEQGCILLDNTVKKTLVVFKKGGKFSPKLYTEDGYQAEIRYFVDCILNDKEPTITTPSEARLALETALAARESLDAGKSIKLPL